MEKEREKFKPIAAKFTGLAEYQKAEAIRMSNKYINSGKEN